MQAAERADFLLFWDFKTGFRVGVLKRAGEENALRKNLLLIFLAFSSPAPPYIGPGLALVVCEEGMEFLEEVGRRNRNLRPPPLGLRSRWLAA